MQLKETVQKELKYKEGLGGMEGARGEEQANEGKPISWSMKHKATGTFQCRLTQAEQQ